MSSSLSSVNMSPDKLRLMASGLTNARKDYDQKWDATLTSLDTLKQAIAKCRAQVKENPSKTKQLLKSTNKAAKRAAKTVSREHKVGYQALSKYSDFVDQSFVSGTTVSSLANPDAFEDVTDSVQRIIAEHFALEGLFDASQAFYEETGVGSTESLDQFRSFHHITDALHKQNIAPFERWLHENMGRLSGAAASKMMLHYVKHRFVHMIAHNQTTEALAFAHQHMGPLYIEHSEGNESFGAMTKWYDDDVVPVQVPVNQDKQCHSVFVCPVSK
ncbi:hypothetical protein PTSG_07666 [Salpingoeca rosetta]|uniref:Uncharacterized protein n=1 Tax=Salpingoeca rosetta (strain ATCC 50818 / BSB-021) TaxID=946362 RepID=F2UHF2_SALR5|nr:uncharacterized protein PTSG_07666 [Salpingoeca rosetta]EGD76551.1 hypothetical protein PTSG_07666 [Salpingoeca rosetta]|eukprot:XP_004991465.1 hypothetical protein PTSG_07666 [Salpingoeca rosetta]